MTTDPKPLTAAEIDELGRLCECARVNMEAFPNKRAEDYPHLCQLMFSALPRLLAMLTPPATNRCQRCGGVEPHGMDCPCSAQPPSDAAVREAVEELSKDVEFYSRDGRHTEFIGHIDTLLSYVRAAQGPRLTGERLEAVRHVRKVLNFIGNDSCVRKIDAAFPELGEG